MPRSIWNGAVAFGAVTVPVKVFGALEDRTIHFRELHAKDGSEVAHVLVGPDGAEIPRERVAKGFEVAPDEYIVLTNDEIKAADQPARKAIELEDFVPADEIDPAYYDKPYHLGPQKGAEAGYALLAAALEKTGRVGIGRVVLRAREQLVSVRPVDGALRMQVMRFAEQLVPAKEMDVAAPSKAPAKKEVEMAGALVETLETDFDPERYKDTYRERVLEIVAQKEQGKEIEAPEPEPKESSDDLMAALQASLDAAGKGSGSSGKKKKGAKR
jgi:DNA end-binding protein Ku